MMRTEHTNLLALDTSTRVVGIAVYNGVQVLSEYAWKSQDFHTVELAPAVSDSLSKARVSVNDLCAVGVAIGPGSFTGLRIGLAFAKGLSLAQNLPIVGIPTLDALAAAQPVNDLPLAAVLQAGRSRLAVGWYSAIKKTWQPSMPVEVLTPEELYERVESPTLLCGELTEEERELFARKSKQILLASPAGSLRRASFLAELAWGRWQAGKIDDPASLAPIYLHYNSPIPG